jgi:hypothetical protein
MKFQDNLGYTPIFIAASNGYIEIVKELINDFNLIQEIYVRNNIEMCKELLVNHIKHLIYNCQDFE